MHGEFKCDGRKCNSNKAWNEKLCPCDCKNSIKHHVGEVYIWSPSTCTCRIDKYLKKIVDDSVLVFDKVIEEVANKLQKMASSKTENFYILLAFSLITISQLIIVNELI